jgi:hypothetical protein
MVSTSLPSASSLTSRRSIAQERHHRQTHRSFCARISSDSECGIKKAGLICVCPDLADICPRDGGIVLAAQTGWTLSELIAALDRLLSETEAEEWLGQVHWLNDWR